MKNPRVAIYLRVSTADQSFRSQEQGVKDYCRRRGWSNLVIYREKESGAKANRTELNRLLDHMREGRFDAIAVYKLDRLGRSLPHLANIISELKTRRIAIVATSQAIDTTPENPAASLILNVLSCVAEFERDLIRERTVQAIATAKRRGVTLGRRRKSDDKIAAAFAIRKRKPKATLAEIKKATGLSASYLSRLLSGKKPTGRK